MKRCVDLEIEKMWGKGDRDADVYTMSWWKYRRGYGDPRDAINERDGKVGVD